ncbi:MAG: adenosylcobinamide-GDP ribazoletransferase [Desulfocapsaceae bacterium]|nr:adenosylcobinamide-GDP ribazoletransferase [Desulfocapsaceae bacterium]
MRPEILPPWCRHPLLCFLAAFRFLTIIPIGWRAEQDGEYFRHSLHYFPVLGGLIGLAVAVSGLVFQMVFPGMVVAVLVMILLAMVSGGLHFDGLADTADGFFSSRPRERILEIMRDSRTGAMGVIVTAMVLLLKFAGLASLQPADFLKTVFLMPMAGRCAIVLSMAVLPYARTEGGLGNLFYSKYCRISALWSMLLLLGLTPWAGIGTMVYVGCIVVFTVLLFSFWCRRKIGGATGDTLGAVCELTEMAVAVGMASTIRL